MVFQANLPTYLTHIGHETLLHPYWVKFEPEGYPGDISSRSLHVDACKHYQYLKPFLMHRML